MAQDILSYTYATASNLVKSKQNDKLLLAKYSEIEKKDVPCYFWGRLTEPYIVSRCLIGLSNIVQSSFNLSHVSTASFKDPIVTAGNGKIRFEGFSHCAGVYARLDVLPDGLDGEFMANGTTNVDFNQPMIAALGSVRKAEKVVLSVGQKEFGIHKNGKSSIERKVSLPSKWIKGLATVQFLLAETEEVMTLNRIQAIQLFRSIPKSNIKTDYYLSMRGKKPILTPVKSSAAVCIGGLSRLRLIEQLIPLADSLKVYAHPEAQSTAWQLCFGALRFTLSLSPDNWRGFSGEGATLESLLEDIPDELLSCFDNFSYANQEFTAAQLAFDQKMDFSKIENLSARLAAMGLLGYDLDSSSYFYRRLPFRLERIIGLNPRLKAAEKLLTEEKVMILNRSENRVEARVEGNGVSHTIILEGEHSRCTCAWYARNKGERGFCKHVLAVKKMVSNS